MKRIIGKKKNSREKMKRIIGRNKNSSPKSALRSCPIACEIFEPFWKLGYGPAGGDVIDEDGWIEYFEALTPSANTKVMDHMHRVYILRDPEEEWDGWIEQVDENLTSRSEIFKDYPDCQLMWQKGYAPPESVNWDVKAWQDHVGAMSTDAYTAMERALFCRPIDDEDKVKVKAKVNQKELWEKYEEQFAESEGFDIEVYPTDGSSVIQPVFNDTTTVRDETYHNLSDCARMAVDVYNQLEGTEYTLNRVVKACSQLVAGMDYFITFEAMSSKPSITYENGIHYIEYSQVFQARVYAPLRNKEKEVVLVRPKAMVRMPNEMKDLFTPPCDSNHAAKLWETYLKQIKISEGFDIDVYPTDGRGIIKPMFNNTSPVSAEIYHMLSNYSRIALDAYNQREGTDYTVNRVVKVCTQVDCAIMYFITFEVKKSKDRFQVFQAKVYDRPNIGDVYRRPFTRGRLFIEENKVLLVRPKAMVKDLVMTHRDYHEDATRLGKYVEQIKETEGFDIDVWISDGDGTIVPMFYDMRCAKTEDSLINYSRDAIYAYNVTMGSHYTFYQVLKACTQTVAVRMYYITFEAICSDKRLHVFQAVVFDPAKGQNKVLQVRPKTPRFY